MRAQASMVIQLLKRMAPTANSSGETATAKARTNGSPDPGAVDRHQPIQASSKADQFVEMLVANDGRMKQTAFVAETEWSKATVSRVLSEMEASGTIRKISVGRENVITLVGAEPDWYSPPDGDERQTSRTGESTSDADSAILLVEDKPADARMVKEALREASISNPVHVVQDGSDAMEFLLQQGQYAHAPRPGLILLDLSLLRVDGDEVLRELDERQLLSGVPLLVLSHSDDPDDVATAYDRGATAYLTKPSEFDELVELVSAIESFWLSHVVRP